MNVKNIPNGDAQVRDDNAVQRTENGVLKPELSPQNGAGDPGNQPIWGHVWVLMPALDYPWSQMKALHNCTPHIRRVSVTREPTKRRTIKHRLLFCFLNEAVVPLTKVPVLRLLLFCLFWVLWHLESPSKFADIMRRFITENYCMIIKK